MESAKKFVIQEHTQGNDVHWDLMLEAGEVLETYRLDVPPEELLGQVHTTIKIFDHPLKFLTYEGSVNKGKGSVKIADSGTYQLLSESVSNRQLQLDGEILKGEFTLAYIKDDEWEFRHG